MSLINQMLKDLEHRRSQDVDGAASVIPGVKRYSVARRRRSPWVIALSSVSAILLLVISWLLWDRMSPPQQLASKEDKRVVSQIEDAAIIKTGSASVSPGKVVVTKPVVKETVSKENETGSAPVVKKVITAEEKPVPVVQKKMVKTISGDDKQVDTAPAGTVEKVTRTLSAEQQADVYYKKGHALLTRGQAIAGEQALKKALETYPQHIKAREVLAGLYIKSGRVVEAGELLKQALIHNPGHSLFAMLQARLLLQQNRIQAAMDVLQINAPAVTDNLDYHALMAVAYQKQGLHEKTVAKYREILQLKPAAGVWWLGMAISLESLGRQQQAADTYNKARQTGTLSVDLLRYADSRIALLRESGYSLTE